MTDHTDDRSRKEYGTAREVSSEKDAQTEQMIAELCEVLEGLEANRRLALGTINRRKIREALAKARGEA